MSVGDQELDLDIVLYGNETIDSGAINRTPLRHACQREFVLYPLAEIAPELQLPMAHRLQELLKSVCSMG